MRIIFAHDFVKRLKKIPAPVREQYYERLELFQEGVRHPLLADHTLMGEWKGHRSINVTGNYRAIYREIATGVFEFVAMGTHAELYDK